MVTSASAEPTRDVLIRMNNGHIVPASILLPAQGIATRVLAQAGIRARWGKTADSGPPAEMNECRDRHLNVIDITFLAKAPANQSLVHMATASPFASGGMRIRVFWDRILDAHPADGSSVQRSLLGHVLAHEIGHILIGSKEHSPSGLMKANWTTFELSSMQARPLPISQLDAEAMQQNLDAPAMSCSGVLATAMR
jgi:hypothetical protein